jgi:hypothetical protein
MFRLFRKKQKRVVPSHGVVRIMNGLSGTDYHETTQKCTGCGADVKINYYHRHCLYCGKVYEPHTTAVICKL